MTPTKEIPSTSETIDMEQQPLTEEEMTFWRVRAEDVLRDLHRHSRAPPPPSWVRGEDDESWNAQRSPRCSFFDRHGFWVEKAFCSPEQIQALKEEMVHLAQNDWDPIKGMDTFGTDPASNTQRGDYFLDSADRTHYFAETTALQDGSKLKDEFQTNKVAALNKAGHGMHTQAGAFRDYAFSDKMRQLVLELGWKDPVVPQSMYIFKQPKIGGTVHSHQDSTFLYTTPRQTCLGLWLALDDATLENGCLWVRPNSHMEPLRRQFIRNPEYFDHSPESSSTSAKNKLTFVHHHYPDPNVPWEGGLPNMTRDLHTFVPVEVKAGDLVTFCGTLDHWSLPNFSDQPRHTFQLHLVEGPSQGITWSPSNWLQYPPNVPFLRLLDQELGEESRNK